MDVPTFSESANWARVAAGLRGGQMFNNINLAPSMSVVNGLDAGVMEKMQAADFTQGSPIDVWQSRRANANGK